MATLVLIHGAFTGGWIWGRTARALSKLGHEVYRPTLTGCGERSHLLRPDIVLTMHVEDVAQLLFHEDLDRVVLVGHGYGAMIASAVAHRHSGKVGGVVRLDGVVPERGAVYMNVAGRTGGRVSSGYDDSDWLVPPPPTENFGIECRELARWLSVRLQSFPRSCLSASYPYGPRDRALPGVYLRTTGLEDPAIEAQAAAAALSGMKLEELPTGPLPMLTNPGRLAKTLDAAVQNMSLAAESPRGRRASAGVRKHCLKK